MTEETKELLSVEPKKRGRKPNSSLESKVAELEEKVEKLTKAFEHVATNAGCGNLLVEHGFKRHIPTKAEMKRYTG